ncbi:hypothetical protein ACX12M_18695 [Cellulosimicrobium cellulans]
MTEREYELTFEIADVDEGLEDAIVDATDGTLASMYGTTLVTLTAPGPSALAAATCARLLLSEAGASVYRCVEDLVSRSEIAHRVGVTAQAVGNWVRGDRRDEVRFPSPYVFSAGGLWLWSEVIEWLDRVHPDLAAHASDGFAYPSRHDHAAIAGQIETSRRAVASASEWREVELPGRHYMVRDLGSPGHVAVAADNLRTDFGTAA